MRKLHWILLLFTLVGLFSLGTAAWVAAQTPITVEPTQVRSDLGGVLSLYATGTFTFSPHATVRLEGYGILTTAYVNPTTLQATVPTGLGAGTYTLRILNDDGMEVAVGSVIISAAPAPTSTPKPASEPKPGRPILTMRNYTVTPMQVKPGQEFTVTVEVYNNGSRAGENTMVVFPGGAFLPLGDKGHLFWQVHINATFVATQRFRAPREVTNGIHNVEVQLSANDYEGTHYDYTAQIPVEVVGASTGNAAPTGKPKVLIESSTSVPEKLSPGDIFTLTLNLSNRGSRTATNVMVHAAPEMVIPAEGSGFAAIDTLRIDASTTVTLPLQLKPSKEGGRQGLAISLEYSDPSGGAYSEQQTVGLNIDTSLANQPQVLITSYRTDPEIISPGDSFTLTLVLGNVGGGDARSLMLALGGEEGENLGAFVPVEGSNASFLPLVAVGETPQVQMRLMAISSAETKAHNLPIALAYDTNTSTRQKDTQRVSLIVRRRPSFKVSYYRPVEGGAMVGMPYQLPIELVNTGSARFTIPTLEVTGTQLFFEGEASTYVGNLDPGGSWTFDVMATPQMAGMVDVLVNIHYIDDLNQTQIISQTLPLDVMDMPTPEGPDGPNGPDGPIDGEPETLLQKVGRFFMGFLGLGS